jgi:hypothetical protein
MKLENVMLLVIVVLGAVCLLAGSAQAVIVDLDGVEPGTVVAGETPGGAVTEGPFEDFLLAVENHGDGPHSAVVAEAVMLYATPDGQAQTPEYADHHDYELRVDGQVAVSVTDGSQWTDPGIFIDLDGYDSISEVTLRMNGSVGFARIGYFPYLVANDAASWGTVKVLYR